MKKYNRGFTIVELLIVVAIIAILAAIVLTQTGLANSKGRDAARMRSLKELQKAVEIYRTETGEFPNTGGNWFAGGNCNTENNPTPKGYGADGYIPGLVPNFISRLPEDPAPRFSDGRCFSYVSNGTEYMIVANDGAESFNPNTGHNFDIPTKTDKSIGIYSDGANFDN